MTHFPEKPFPSAVNHQKLMEFGLRHRRLDVVQRALAEGFDPNSVISGPSADGTTTLAPAIAIAFAASDALIVNALLCAGADPNVAAAGVKDRSAFLDLCAGGKESLVRAVLNNTRVPIDFYATDGIGRAAGPLCARLMGVDTLQLLQDDYERNTWSLNLGSRGSQRSRSHLWSSVDQNGCNAIMAIAQNTHRAENPAALRWLLSHRDLNLGAHIEQADGFGRTALWFAMTSGSTGLFRILLEHGARIDVRLKSGRTFLDEAAAWPDKHGSTARRDYKDIHDILTAMTAAQAASRSVDAVLSAHRPHASNPTPTPNPIPSV